MLSDFFSRLSQLYSQRFVPNKNIGDGNGQDNVPKASKGNEEAGKAAHEGRAPRPEKACQEHGRRGTDRGHRSYGAYRAHGDRRDGAGSYRYRAVKWIGSSYCAWIAKRAAHSKPC